MGLISRSGIAAAFMLCAGAACGTGRSILQAEAGCAPPCWQGVTPGKTQAAEVPQLLAEAKHALSGEVDDLGPYGIYDHRYVFALAAGGDGIIHASDGQVVAIRFIGLHAPLSRVLEALGPPESVLAVRGYDLYVNAVDPARGIYWETRYPSWRMERATLSQTTPVDEIGYFDPASFELLLDAGMMSGGSLDAEEVMGSLRPWRGYGRIVDLYPLFNP